MAPLSEDSGLPSAFASGPHIHRTTGSEVFSLKLEDVTANERRAATAINFGLMYGMSAFGLARNLGIGRRAAQDYIALSFSRYPRLREFIERTRTEARERGNVEPVFGLRLYLEHIQQGPQHPTAGAQR